MLAERFHDRVRDNFDDFHWHQYECGIDSISVGKVVFQVEVLRSEVAKPRASQVDA